MADREGDLYPAFARRPGAVELLVRAQTERGLAGGGYLFAHLDGLPIADRFILDLPAIPGRSARRAAMVLRYGPVSLSRPRNSADRNLPATVALYALDVREIEAPAGVEPVHWRLLSSYPIPQPSPFQGEGAKPPCSHASTQRTAIGETVDPVPPWIFKGCMMKANS